MKTKQELLKAYDDWVDQGKQLKEQIDALPDDKPVPAGRWKPEYDGEYWLIKGGAVTDNCWYNDSLDLAYFALGNVYRTEEEAQAALDQQLATVRILDRIAELEGSDTSGIEFLIGVDWNLGILHAVSEPLYRTMPEGYYGSKQTIDTVIKEMRSDCLLMLGVETQDV